jgi:hypothetical protein
MRRATERNADAIAPAIPPVLMAGTQSSGRARWHDGCKAKGMCTCKVCVSQRMFLRILALLLA